jgi:energy-coupling factor transporter ATP-binding protein EcfA2
MSDESVYPINQMASELRQQHIAAEKAHMKWDCEQKILMGRHVLVLGTTGSGKTYFAAYYAFIHYDRFIFVNTQLEEVVTKVTQVTCRTPDEIFDALEDGYKRIEFVPTLNRDEAKEQLSNIRMRLFEIGRKMGLPEGEFWITILIDEIQDFAEKQKESDVNNYFRRGRYNRVRVWGLTLKPQDISGTVLSQTEFQIIFISGNFQQQYFRGHHIPYDDWLPWLDRDYHYVLLNQKGEACFCTPINTKEIRS